MGLVKKSGGSFLNPVCSVCIANFNGEHLIGEAIQSVYEQTCHFPVEIIVHDDASTDRSVEVIRRRYPDVLLLKSEHNVGYCISNNRMVAKARGDYILLLNNDASLFPNALEALHRTALGTDNMMILGLPQYDAGTGSLIDCGTLLDPFFNPIPNKHRGRAEVAMVIGACLWLPKRMWDDIGGFPELFESNAEDLYLCCCARLRGFPVAVCPESGFRHRVGSSFGGGKVRRGVLNTTVRRRALSERNKSFALAVTCPAPWLYAMLPLHLLLLMLEGLMLSAVKINLEVWNRIYWPCLNSLKSHRLELLRRRRIIQQTRCISTSEFFSQFEIIPQKLRMLLRYGIPEIK